jgi:hypothetical protein
MYMYCIANCKKRNKQTLPCILFLAFDPEHTCNKTLFLSLSMPRSIRFYASR